MYLFTVCYISLSGANEIENLYGLRLSRPILNTPLALIQPSVIFSPQSSSV